MKKLLLLLILVILQGCNIPAPPAQAQKEIFPSQRPCLRIHVHQDARLHKKINDSKWEKVAVELKKRHPEWPQTVAEITAELDYAEFKKYMSDKLTQGLEVD